VFIFQTSLHAAAQDAEVCPFIISPRGGRECGWMTCSSPKSGSENMPNSLNAMTTTKSEIINHATYDGSVRSDLSRHLLTAALGVATLLAGPGALRAGNLYVPNYSFESPNIGTNSPYAAPVLDSWNQSAQPSWYVPANFGGSPWAYLMGTFYNLPNFTNATATNASFIDNCNGIQAVFLFAVPQVAIFQDINAAFNAGKTYTLTVGLIGGGGNMAIGSTLQLSLYYRDASSKYGHGRRNDGDKYGGQLPHRHTLDGFSGASARSQSDRCLGRKEHWHSIARNP